MKNPDKFEREFDRNLLRLEIENPKILQQTYGRFYEASGSMK